MADCSRLRPVFHLRYLSVSLCRSPITTATRIPGIDGEPGGRVVEFVTSPPARRISGRTVVRWNGRSALVPVLCVLNSAGCAERPLGPLNTGCVKSPNGQNPTENPIKRPPAAQTDLKTGANPPRISLVGSGPLLARHIPRCQPVAVEPPIRAGS